MARMTKKEVIAAAVKQLRSELKHIPEVEYSCVSVSQDETEAFENRNTAYEGLSWMKFEVVVEIREFKKDVK